MSIMIVIIIICEEKIIIHNTPFELVVVVERLLLPTSLRFSWMPRRGRVQ